MQNYQALTARIDENTRQIAKLNALVMGLLIAITLLPHLTLNK